MRTKMLAVVALLPALGSPAMGQEPSRPLHALFEDYVGWRKEQFPEEAMAQGDYANAHRLSDNSLAAIEARHKDMLAFLDQLLTIDKAMLSADDLVDYELFELMILREVDGHRFRTFLAPIGGRFGPQQRIPQMADGVRFDRARDYENYLARLEQVPVSIDNTIELLQKGLDEGRTPPAVTIRTLPDQFEAIARGEGLDDLASPFERVPSRVSAAELRTWRKRFDEVSLPAVRGAMERLEVFVVETYIPGCRESIAASDWPDGEAFYAHQLRRMTTTDMTAQEIHDLGLSEVLRIRAEMMRVIRSTDFLTLFPEARSFEPDELFEAFIDFLRTDPRFYHETEEALLAGYRDICKQVDGWMPKLFRTLPRLPYGVKAIPSFMAPSQTTAYYSAGDIRNAEAGIFYANTYALDQRPIYEMVALTLHEAVPGHHHQIAIANELQNVPEFRKRLWFTVFGEGWALYAERLGLEMGMYDDPYDDFGRLLYEMWRSCRLVVDPGMHALGWSRDRGIEYMLENTALSRLNIETEIDRYIAWPGQATAYKIGEIRITQLRADAEERLGKRFDIRVFHDVVLGAGSVPLSVLDRRVDFWINSKRIDAYD